MRGAETHWITCSLHLGCRSPSQSSLTPGSPSPLQLRSILVRVRLAIRVAARSWQAELATQHLFRLGGRGWGGGEKGHVTMVILPLVLCVSPCFGLYLFPLLFFF